MASLFQAFTPQSAPVAGRPAAPAVPVPGALDTIDMLQFVTLDVHGRSYALPIGAVIEFRTWIEPTPLPHSPSYVLGIINIRGEIVPVFDVGARLGHGPTEPSTQHVITLVQTPSEQVVGLLVDDVSDIRAVPAVTPLAAGETDAAEIESVIEIGDSVLGVISVAAVCLTTASEDGGA
ncbi:MAG: chemotaxis protein CheW [Rhodospirillaceae bacterium]